MYQSVQEVTMSQSQLLTQIQPIPANFVQSCNFIQSPQLFCKVDQSAYLPSACVIIIDSDLFPCKQRERWRDVWCQMIAFARLWKMLVIHNLQSYRGMLVCLRLSISVCAYACVHLNRGFERMRCVCACMCVCEKVCRCVMQRRGHTQKKFTKNPISMGYWVTYLNHFNCITSLLTNIYAYIFSLKICEDWVSTCTAVNIPLSKSDHPEMWRFIRENVINGGAIPGFHQLQEKYGAVYHKEKEALKTHLAQKPVAVIFDETPDVEGRCLLNILIAPLEKDESGRIPAYLADKLTTCYVHGTHKELDWQCLWQTSGPSECVHAELLTDVLTSWLLQKKIPWVHDRKTPSRKEGNHGSKSMCYPVELLVQRSALPFRALRTLQGVHRDGNTGKTVSTHLYKVS